MKKQNKKRKGLKLWLILLLITDLFFVFLLWLASPDNFGSFVVIILLYTFLVVLAGYWTDRKSRQRKLSAFQSFLADPGEETTQHLLNVVDESWHSIIWTLSSELREQSQNIKNKQLVLKNYQEYIEAWAHEIKNPLSLAMLVLSNHQEAMSPYVYNRMEHVRHSVSNNVEQILYYARLQSAHVDYQFERIELKDCIFECLEEFHTIVQEKNVALQLALLPVSVVSDKKVLSFILAQLFSNAFKYTANEEGIVHIVNWTNKDTGKICLAIRDNGKGVLIEDLPFLFDKGFTGNHPNRQNATGMGLYFVKKTAEMLSIEVDIEATSTSGQGFGIRLTFPIVE